MRYTTQQFKMLRNGIEQVFETNYKDPLKPWARRSASGLFDCIRQIMKEIEDELGRMSPYEQKHLYGTFYIKKGSDPEVRTFSKAEALRWGKTKEGKPLYREIQYLKNDFLKALVKDIGKHLDIEILAYFHHVQGFSEGKGVLTNMLEHTINRKPRHVINMDLENAFHQITKDNIKMLAQHVFGWNNKRAYTFAHVMTHNGRMVQGNPTSPIILNLMALIMDFRILGFCNSIPNLKLKYTRYADDITISSIKWVPRKLYNYISDTIINDSGFCVNSTKTKSQRNLLEITGVRFIGEQNVVKTMHRKKFKRDIRRLKHLQKKGIVNSERVAKDGKNIPLECIERGLHAWLHPDLKNIEFNYKMRRSIKFGQIRFRNRKHYNKTVKKLNETKNQFKSLLATENQQLDWFKQLGLEANDHFSIN